MSNSNRNSNPASYFSSYAVRKVEPAQVKAEFYDAATKSGDADPAVPVEEILGDEYARSISLLQMFLDLRKQFEAEFGPVDDVMLDDTFEDAFPNAHISEAYTR
jgi:hypothetical protein